MINMIKLYNQCQTVNHLLEYGSLKSSEDNNIDDDDDNVCNDTVQYSIDFAVNVNQCLF